MVFFIYSRKSVYTGKGESVENQIEMCRRYIADKFPETRDEDIFVYEDEGFSAKDTARPMFKRMLRDMDVKCPDFIVCYRLDRISRSVSDFSFLIEDLNARNISFICIKEEFDTSKPMGKAMMYIASVFSQLERETIAERVRDNMLMLARTGRWLGGTAPTGYASEKICETIVEGKVKTSCALKELPHELETVKAIFVIFLETGSLSAVSRRLAENRMFSRTGNPYSLPGLKHILKNPVYCRADAESLSFFSKMGSEVCFDEKDFKKNAGLMAYNKRDYSRKGSPHRPMDQWIIAAGKHRGLICGKAWVKAQELLGVSPHRAETASSGSTSYESLLKGLLICGKCEGSMSAKKRSRGSENTPSFDYICSKKLKKGSKYCPSQNLNGPRSDRSVFCALLELTCTMRSLTLTKELARFIPHTSGSLSPASCLRLDEISSQLASSSFIFDIMPDCEKRSLIRSAVKTALWDGKRLHLFLF